jgi:hypothetical protein
MGILVACRRCNFLGHNGLANRGKRNSRKFQVLYSKRNADDRYETRGSRQHMTNSEPNAGKDEPNDIANGAKYPRANIVRV